MRLRVRVTPRAGRDQVNGIHDDVLWVRLAALPVEGRANEALVRLLSRVLGVPPRDIRVVQGATARHKLVEIDGLAVDDVCTRLKDVSRSP